MTDANAVAGLQPVNAQNASVYREYDELNRLTLERDALNGETRYTYDQFSYDDFGDLTQVSNNDVTYNYTYTACHALASKTDSRLGKVMCWFYDKVDNRRGIQSNGGAPFYYIYNEAGYAAPPQDNRLREIHWGIPTGALINQFEYDDAGRITGKCDGAGNLVYRLLYNGKG